MKNSSAFFLTLMLLVGFCEMGWSQRTVEEMLRTCLRYRTTEERCNCRNDVLSRYGDVSEEIASMAFYKDLNDECSQVPYYKLKDILDEGCHGGDCILHRSSGSITLPYSKTLKYSIQALDSNNRVIATARVSSTTAKLQKFKLDWAKAYKGLGKLRIQVTDSKGITRNHYIAVRIEN